MGVGLASIMLALGPLLLGACAGGDATVVVHPPPIGTSADTTIPPPEPVAAASLVRFDDLGITFSVPAGFKVLGDRELEERIHSSATPHLESELKKHGPDKRGLPLLALSKDGLNVTLLVVVVPADATAIDVLAQQEAVMQSNLEGFEVVGSPKNRMTDGVNGAELAAAYYTDKTRSTHVKSRMRLYAREGVATLEAIVWTDAAGDRDHDADALLDGLHFVDLPKPP